MLRECPVLFCFVLFSELSCKGLGVWGLVGMLKGYRGPELYKPAWQAFKCYLVLFQRVDSFNRLQTSI